MGLKTLKAWMEKTFLERAGAVALTFLRDGKTETVLTYGQLSDEISAFADKLSMFGVRPGDRVILFLKKSVYAVVAHFALQRIGAVAVHLNPGFKSSEMRYLLTDARARLVLCDAGRHEWILEIDPKAEVLELATDAEYVRSAANDGQPETNYEDPRPEDPGLIIYTSGTTGNPKGAILTQANLTWDAANIIDIWEITQEDRLCHALPLFHVHGLCFALHTALLSGAHVLMLDRFDPDTVLEVLACKDNERRCTVFMAVPAMYTKLMNRFSDKKMQADFSHIGLLTSGSAPLLPQEFERIRDVFGQEPVEREGMSETGMNFSNPLRGRRIPGSIGVPLPGLAVRIVDPDSLRDVAAGHVGEIWLKGPAITPGYWQKPEETDKTFFEGWFRTGDLGKKDENGYYYLTDRIKHIIISGGENVSAKEVEMVINRMDGVVESSVVGIQDPKWGERVAAAVVLEPGTDFDPARIREYCKTHLHDWKCPKEIQLVAEMPRNTMGKVLKEEVKKIFTENS